MKTEDIKVGGFYLWTYSNCIEYVTKITDNRVYYESYDTIDRQNTMHSCDDKFYYTLAMRPISPAEIFLRYGNDPKVIKWVKEKQVKNDSYEY